MGFFIICNLRDYKAVDKAVSSAEQLNAYHQQMTMQSTQADNHKVMSANRHSLHCMFLNRIHPLSKYALSISMIGVFRLSIT